MPHRLRRPWLLVLLAVVVAVVAPVAWYLGSPLFINQVVDEAFPVAGVAAPAGPTGTVAPVSAPPATPTAIAAQAATATPLPAPTATPARSTATAAPAAARTTVPTPAPVSPAVSPTAAPPTATPAPAAPVVLRQGSFTRIDAVHWAEGKAVIYRLPDGQRVLRLEDFRAGNGPGLFVYLSGHPRPRGSQQMHDGGAIELAPLKGNIGNQNYVLPAGLDLAAYRSVVIFCKPFTVVFSTAELA
jgi:hypothetical protein